LKKTFPLISNAVIIAYTQVNSYLSNVPLDVTIRKCFVRLVDVDGGVLCIKRLLVL